MTNILLDEDSIGKDSTFAVTVLVFEGEMDPRAAATVIVTHNLEAGVNLAWGWT